jgi:hyperosmotically inducible periplasmic protein
MKKTASSIALLAAVATLLMLNIPVQASEMDSRIESSARQSYIFKTYLQGDDITIDSQEGAVTLTGIVADHVHKSLAYETVAGLPGVKSVDNRLEIKGTSPVTDSDVWIRNKVRTTLLFHRSVSADTTTIDVRDGIVTLRGDALSGAQRDLTAEYARDVAGVKGVNNKMTVAGTANRTQTIDKNIDDSSITAQVKMTLLYHRSTSALNTKVETKDGVVTMYGKAGSTAEKDLAGKFAGDVNGVKIVNNRITIE